MAVKTVCMHLLFGNHTGFLTGCTNSTAQFLFDRQDDTDAVASEMPTIYILMSQVLQSEMVVWKYIYISILLLIFLILVHAGIASGDCTQPQRLLGGLHQQHSAVLQPEGQAQLLCQSALSHTCNARPGDCAAEDRQVPCCQPGKRYACAKL